jgi:hypothetical protein
MKRLAIVLALAALGGCATYQPAPAYYGSRAYAAPGEWQTVSVTPVPLGTGAAAHAGTMTTTTGVSADPVPTYLPPPATTTTVVQQPIYAAPSVVYGAPVYAAPAPVYVAPDPWYWWPPISIGLGFSWNHWSGGRGGGWHGGGRGGYTHHR